MSEATEEARARAAVREAIVSENALAAMSLEDREQYVSRDQEEDIHRRAAAARRDAAMLGESGYERIEADYYPTPRENVDCALTHVQPNGLIWEPACGRGDISIRLQEFGHTVYSTDLFDQGYGCPGMDFFAQSEMPTGHKSIWTNPPYAATEEHPEGLAEAFVRHALDLTEPVKGQVVMFLRNEFDCGKKRMSLFGMPPFHKKIIVTKRPRWIEGSTGSPRHSYAWFCWDWRHIKGNAAVVYSHPSIAAPISHA